MRRWSVVCLLLVATSAGLSEGSTARLRSLGNDTRLLIDNTNVFIYPSAIVDYSEIIVEPFDNWGGVLYGIDDRHFAGIMLERPLSSVDRLDRTVSQDGSGRFDGLYPKPWLDLLYGVRLGDSAAAGGSISYSFDRTSTGGGTSHARALDIGLGFSLERRLQLAIDVGLRGLSSDGDAMWPDTSIKGSSLGVEARGIMERGDRRIMPIASASFGSDDADDASYYDLTLGVGVGIRPAESTEATLGLFVDEHSETRTVDGREFQDRLTVLPRFVGGAETKIGSLTARVGVERSVILSSRGTGDDNNESFNSTMLIRFGLGLKFGSVDLDGVIEQDFLRDGPYIIGGNRHGGGLFSTASIIYRL